MKIFNFFKFNRHQQQIVQPKCETCKNCYNACQIGHLECLKKFHKQDKEFYRETYISNILHPNEHTMCSIASQYGNLDCLKYLHENGAPWDAFACYYATLNDHKKCVKYLRQNNCSCDFSYINSLWNFKKL